MSRTSEVPSSSGAGSAVAPRLFKGHGTENDFVLLEDLDAAAPLSAQLVRSLCDRRSGIGADGLLRVVRTKCAAEPDVRSQADEAEFFMDFHNADGSVAEMCGNGLRVFAQYLRFAGLCSGDLTIATRGGSRRVHFDGDDISVEMGRPVGRAEHPGVAVAGLTPGRFSVAAYDLPNPHVVVRLADNAAAELAGLDLVQPPSVQPPLPDGQNVEFVTLVGDHQLAMRVHERGVGETRSCGTGICAAVAAVTAGSADPEPWTVDVPGGRCTVSHNPDGQLVLTGPAVLVAEVHLQPEWLSQVR